VRDKPGSGKQTYVRKDEDQPPGYLNFRQENWSLIPGWPHVFIRPLKLYLPPRKIVVPETASRKPSEQK